MAWQDFRRVLIRLGRTEDLRARWAKLLEADPPEHAAWYGYAEFCLFLGRMGDYHQARKALLARFGKTTDPQSAERSARACLLDANSGDELRQAVALAELAAGADRSEYGSTYPHFVFVRGLAEYRQGRFDRAIATMQGEASGVLGPAPGLVRAMALQRSGREKEARENLDAAVESHDWRAENVHDQDDWIVHALRREAETLILPQPSASPRGSNQ